MFNCYEVESEEDIKSILQAENTFFEFDTVKGLIDRKIHSS